MFLSLRHVGPEKAPKTKQYLPRPFQTSVPFLQGLLLLREAPILSSPQRALRLGKWRETGMLACSDCCVCKEASPRQRNLSLHN